MLRWWLTGTAWTLSMLSAVSAVGARSNSLPAIESNQNHAPAGVLSDGILNVQLDIAKGAWHPEADDGITLSVYAFGESGHLLQNPGPLLRVSQGTEIRASLHNTLTVPIVVHGLGDLSAGSDPTIRIAPGMVEEIRFKATKPGLYMYWGASEVDDLKLRFGIDSELTGAFVIDPVGEKPRDEIFVIEMMSEHAGAGARQTLATINGKSWPYTQHFQYNLGEQVHWRWVNATNEPHALHLHGFYYRVDAFNRNGQVQNYPLDLRPQVVTQRIAQGETFDMSWSPDRTGRWLFHCHMFQHMIPAVVPNVPGLSTAAAVSKPDGHFGMHEPPGMGQLVLGITVPQPQNAAAKPAWHAERKLQLQISERSGAPRYALQLRDAAQPVETSDKPGLVGPTIVLTRGQPLEIEIINTLKQPTAIHWHGIELESYYDGVPGWGGEADQITPSIAPGTAFVARMTPPRAGTFIYHTHWHDVSQLTNGLYGPLIVLPPGEKFDPKSDMIFVLSLGDFGALQELALINGTPQSKTLQLRAGKKYRFRLINISPNNQGIQVSLHNANGPADWQIVAKDGADLPDAAVRSTKAQLTITVGETYDVEFTSSIVQDLLFDVLLPAQKIHTTQTFVFGAPIQSANPK